MQKTEPTNFSQKSFSPLVQKCTVHWEKLGECYLLGNPCTLGNCWPAATCQNTKDILVATGLCKKEIDFLSRVSLGTCELVGCYAFPIRSPVPEVPPLVRFSPVGLRPRLPLTMGFRWVSLVGPGNAPFFQTVRLHAGVCLTGFPRLLRSFCTLWDAFSSLRTRFHFQISFYFF